MPFPLRSTAASAQAWFPCDAPRSGSVRQAGVRSSPTRAAQRRTLLWNPNHPLTGAAWIRRTHRAPVNSSIGNNHRGFYGVDLGLPLIRGLKG